MGDQHALKKFKILVFVIKFGDQTFLRFDFYVSDLVKCCVAFTFCLIDQSREPGIWSINLVAMLFSMVTDRVLSLRIQYTNYVAYDSHC